MPDESTHDPKQWFYVLGAMALTFGAILVRSGVLGDSHEPAAMETILFGIAILGAAFLLSWGAEVAQLDISQGLAIAFLAFIAVLPEYAVDLVFSWKAGKQDAGIVGANCGSVDCRQLAIANMTGANRLLIGLGWAAVVLVWYYRSKERRVQLPETRRTDLGFMFLATLWAMKIVILERIDLIDTTVLLALFVTYIWHATKEESEHPDLIGPPLAIAALGTGARRGVTIGMFVFAAVVILLSAEPFADGLVATGERFGIQPFLLVQWLAPLASEAPEMIIAILFVLRAKPQQGLGALVSSKVNQWTLLVGTVPLVYTLARGGLHPMELAPRQVEEVLLTAAQSLFAAAVLANLTISRGEATGLLVLFLAQFGFENTTVRYGFAAAYLIGFVLLIAKDKSARQGLARAARHALSRPR
jgi:cation:H+ antiporter